MVNVVNPYESMEPFKTSSRREAITERRRSKHTSLPLIEPRLNVPIHKHLDVLKNYRKKNYWPYHKYADMVKVGYYPEQIDSPKGNTKVLRHAESAM